jgi:hypothetical protein
VQVALALEARVEGVHCREEIRTAAVRETVAPLEEPLRDAVIVAVWLEGIEPVVAVKAAVVALAGTVTEAGSVRTLAMPPERATEAPPAGAALVNVTVQAVLELEARVEGVHCNEETVRETAREILTAIAAP